MRPFTDFLRDIRKGRVVDAATDDLAELVRAVKDTGKAGSLTLTISIKPQDKEAEQVVVSAAVSTKLPKAALPEGIFFAGIDGDLLRDDPSQKEMFVPTDALGDRAERRAAS